MSSTFFWHDYETFGADPKRDRPAQFAGVRTDEELNEIEEPIVHFCRLSEDALPDIDACLITGISPDLCEEKGINERLFSQHIFAALGKANTIGVGYNSIRFDDEVTRFLFWRNLMDPYQREWAQGCSRWDLLDVVRALYALKPKTCEWPVDSEAKVSFRLENLTKANGLTHDFAHEALSDVRATIALARLIKQREPKFFDYCLALRHKRRVSEILSLSEPKPILHVSGMYGVERGCLAVVWPLGIHPVNKNEVIVWDLKEDPSILMELSAQAIHDRLFTATEHLPEGVSRLPIKTLSLNRSPFVLSALKALSDSRAAELGLDWQVVLSNTMKAKQLRLALDLWKKVYQREPYIKRDVDEALYEGFLEDSDKKICDTLRTMDAKKLAEWKGSFSDPRLGELFFRYRARSFPESLSAEERAQWLNLCQMKREPLLAEYWKHWDLRYAEGSESDRQLLASLKQWILKT